MAFAGFERKGKKKKTMPKIGNNKANNYNKTNQKFNNRVGDTSQILIIIIRRLLRLANNKKKMVAAIVKGLKIVNLINKKG